MSMTYDLDSCVYCYKLVILLRSKSNKLQLSPLIIQLFISAELVVMLGTFFIAALVNDNQLYVSSM